MRSVRGTPEPIASLVVLVDEAFARANIKAAPPASADAKRKMERAIGTKFPPSWRAFLERHNGADLGERGRVLSISESLTERATAPDGLVPVMRTPDGIYYLDTETPDSDGECLVVFVVHGQTETAGTSFLRFLLAYLAESASERVEIDPQHDDHWIDWIGELDRANDREGAWRVARRALLAAQPVGPALLVAVGEEAIRQSRWIEAGGYLEAALTSEESSLRDEEARYDAAAERLALSEPPMPPIEDELRARCLEVLGEGAFATAAVWREEAVRALGTGSAQWARHAARVVLALVPDDTDMPKFLEDPVAPAVAEAAKLAWQAHESTHEEQTTLEVAGRLLDRAQAQAPLGTILLQHARIISRDDARQSLELARRAVLANPALLEAHFHMGEGYLALGDNEAGEKALRQVVERDPAYGVAWSKLALAVLNQGRSVEAVEHALKGVGKSDDPFFTQSVLGDCLFDLEQYEEAAHAYEEALRHFDADHWTLHQAANAYVEMGNYPRASDLYDKAIEHNTDGCHQTFADYADLKRKMGRLGDAVRLYKQASKMAPEEYVYRDLLKEVQRELRDAPN